MNENVEVLELEDDKKDKIVKKDNSLLIMNIKVLIKKIIFIILLFYVMFFWIFGITRISNNSMSPNIAAGDLLLYYRLDHEYAIGDVVTFKKNNNRYILRIIATEGQVITLNSNGDFIIDGEVEYHKTYMENSIPKKIVYPYTVPKGSVFVVGDYRSLYNDSRSFGAISTDLIEGKIISLLQTKDI